MTLATAEFEQPLSEAEVVAVFLKTELRSSTFGQRLREQLQKLGASESVISTPDFSNVAENELRRQLMDYRNFVSREVDTPRNLFFGFPNDIQWGVVSTSTRELLDETLYINDNSFWCQVTGGSRLPRDAVKTFGALDAGTPLPRSVNPERFLAVRDIIERGEFLDLPPIILVTNGQRVINLEGHSRLTGLAWARQGQPSQPFKVILGRSSKLSDWRFY